MVLLLRLSHPLTVSALVIGYVLLAKFSLLFALPDGHLPAALWPASGVTVAGCLLYGYRAWPALLIGTLIINFILTGSPDTALALGTGDTVAALVTAQLISNYTNIDSRFHSVKDALNFFTFCAIGALSSAVIGAAFLFSGHHLQASGYLRCWQTWWLGNLGGLLITLPAIITLRSGEKVRWDRHKLSEALLFAITLGLCAFLIFAVNEAPLLYLFIPIIALLALRFSQSEVAKAVFVIGMMAASATVARNGPLSIFPQTSALILLQIFVGITCLTGLIVSAAVDKLRFTQSQSFVEFLKKDILARQQMQQALETKEKQLEEAQALAHLGNWNWDLLQDRLTISEEMARIYGVTPADHPLSYEKYMGYIPQAERGLVEQIVKTALSDKQPFSYEHGVVRPDGSLRELCCSGMVETDESGKPVRMYGTAHDRTEEKALQRKLQETEELYRMLVEVSPDAIYLLEKGRCMFSNRAGLALAGAERFEQLNGRSFFDFMPSTGKILEERIAQLGLHEIVTMIEGKIEPLEGPAIDVELSASAFSIKDTHRILIVAHDISDRKKSEQRIQYLAHYDVLTGLVNRLLFKERLEHAISQARRASTSLVVLFIDLDRFKNVNDTSGHNTGDDVLRECANRFRECLRESDTIARSGGDEFLVLIESYADQHQVSAVCQKILTAMRQPFYAGGKEFKIGASIGISTYPVDATDADTLIERADIAMYSAKMEGKNHFRYYSPTMIHNNLERYAMESALRHAVERGEMTLYYQPKVDLADGSLCGAEALIRWNHPKYGLLAPHRFISLAEETGMIVELGQWAIREVCLRCSAWKKLGLPPIRVAVNAAYPQFVDAWLIADIERNLKEAGLGPEVLELEITESMLMENAEALMSCLLQLKQIGIHLSVDDFGTGYSSLAYLKRLPVDSVKIDRSFIKDLPGHSEDVAITRAIIALVHSLKRQVIAEGVETEEQLDFLIEHECDAVQGFYFSPALPEEKFREFLSGQRRFSIAYPKTA